MISLSLTSTSASLLLPLSTLCLICASVVCLLACEPSVFFDFYSGCQVFYKGISLITYSTVWFIRRNTLVYHLFFFSCFIPSSLWLCPIITTSNTNTSSTKVYLPLEATWNQVLVLREEKWDWASVFLSSAASVFSVLLSVSGMFSSLICSSQPCPDTCLQGHLFHFNLFS